MIDLSTLRMADERLEIGFKYSDLFELPAEGSPSRFVFAINYSDSSC